MTVSGRLVQSPQDEVRAGADRVRTGPSALVSVSLVVLLVAVAACSWWPVYGSVPFVVCAGGALAAGAALAVLGARLRWSGPVLLAATTALWLLLGVPLAVPSEAWAGVLPTGAGLLDLVVATGTGWRMLLTIDPPVGDFQALLVPVFVLVLTASVIAVSAALRSRVAGLALLPPLVVLVAGGAFGVRQGAAPLAIGAAFTVLALVWLALEARRRGAGRGADRGVATRTRSVLAAVAVAVVTTLIGVGVGALVPADERAVARDAVPTPFDPRAYDSPLSAFRSLVSEPGSDEVELTVSASLAGRLLATARMDDYDGVVYRVGSAAEASHLFSRVPGDIGSPAGERVDYDVTMGAAAGIWVPLAGDPVALRPASADTSLKDGLYWSAGVDTAAVEPGLSPGDAYRATSTLLDEDADPAVLSPLRPETPVPAAPAEVASWASEHSSDQDDPGVRLAAVVAALREGYVSHGQEGEPFSRSGHGADRIAELLTAQPMLGDGEQYAVAGALLARELGFPSRVAVGYRVPDPESPTSGIEVRGADAVAWVEVETAERGWVALDVTPQVRPVPDSVDEEQTSSVQPPRVVPPRSSDVDDPPDTTTSQSTERDEPAGDGLGGVLLAIGAWAGAALGVLALLLSPFLTVIAMKAGRRRRRRRLGPARLRAAGAWSEVRDAAADARLADPPPTATRSEVASAIGGDSAQRLAVLVDRAQFGPEEPADDQVEAIWEEVEGERARLLGSGGRRARIRATVSLRSLRTYHGKGGRRISE